MRMQFFRWPTVEHIQVSLKGVSSLVQFWGRWKVNKSHSNFQLYLFLLKALMTCTLEWFHSVYLKLIQIISFLLKQTLVISTEWDNAVWAQSWTSLTNINFWGKVRMWEEEKTFHTENEQNTCLSWTWSDFQFVTSQLINIWEVKPFKFCPPSENFYWSITYIQRSTQITTKYNLMNSQSKYICVTNTKIKCQNSTNTWEAPHTALATITTTGNRYPAL